MRRVSLLPPEMLPTTAIDFASTHESAKSPPAPRRGAPTCHNDRQNRPANLDSRNRRLSPPYFPCRKLASETPLSSSSCEPSRRLIGPARRSRIDEHGATNRSIDCGKTRPCSARPRRNRVVCGAASRENEPRFAARAGFSRGETPGKNVRICKITAPRRYAPASRGGAGRGNPDRATFGHSRQRFGRQPKGGGNRLGSRFRFDRAERRLGRP